MSNRRARTLDDDMIHTSSEAIDILGGTGAVARWLGVPQNVVSGWRTRGISRNYAAHIYAELVARRRKRLAPQVFGLSSWSQVLMPDRRGKTIKTVSD